MTSPRRCQLTRGGDTRPGPARTTLVLLDTGRTARTRTGRRSLLIRRNDSTGELAYYRCHSRETADLATLVRVAGQRWKVEESFQASKELAGLDEHRVRRWTSWRRWVTLAMLAHAFLAVATAVERALTHTTPDLISLTVNEFRRLFEALLLRPIHATATVLDWSLWRRRHEARARLSHHKRRQQQ